MNLQPNASMLDVPPTNGEPSLLIPKRKNPTAAPLQAEVLDAFNKNKEQLIQPTTPILEVFTDDKDKHSKWSKCIKKHIGIVTNVLLDMGDGTSEDEASFEREAWLFPVIQALRKLAESTAPIAEAAATYAHEWEAVLRIECFIHAIRFPSHAELRPQFENEVERELQRCREKHIATDPVHILLPGYPEDVQCLGHGQKQALPLCADNHDFNDNKGPSAGPIPEQGLARACHRMLSRQNFLWHRHPEMLRSSGQEPLSSRLMRSGLEVPADWFSKPPGVVPLFNPSLLSLEDGSILAVMRMSNGPGCPSLRVSRESCMDTRIFHNALVLAQLDSNLTVQSHVVVDVPELTCRFTPDVEVSGRRFLDEVRGPMDARIFQGSDGEMWIFFYAERNGENNEALRGMHAAPLRVSWRTCGVPGWTFHRNGAFSSEDCPWKGSGDSRSIQSCRNSCDAAGDCNAVSYKPEDPGSGLAGSCELRYCHEGSAEGKKKSPAVLEMPKWQAWLRRPQVQRWRRSPACTGGWQGNGDATNLKSCKQSCEELGACNAILFSSGMRLCVLQRCGEPSKDAAEGWEAWRLEAAEGKQCLESARLQEKNWNLIHGDRDRLFIEYFIEPHIVIEAKLQRRVLHGVTNVRGGFCCLSLPSAMREHIASDAIWAAENPEALPSLPEGNLLLGAGHLQRIRQPFDQAPGDVSRFRRQAKSREDSDEGKEMPRQQVMTCYDNGYADAADDDGDDDDDDDDGGCGAGDDTDSLLVLMR
ncbi:hypothetical protein AK812_SmicGene16934 [Symbiodinium microadriaticum]|uniref:Uncharacterized protein n=1 Tax=Symbiodinium microadriaticum TaxID=2951 RepID=A0A1Q9DYZ5_SYMMI|nr:hypothetical protein AK812_SmicGene16934 [Symbiodinium microadriaticum]